MGNRISEKMEKSPVANPEDVCPKCIAFKKYFSGEMPIGLFRYNCQHCKSFSNGGLYKADGIIAWAKAKQKQKETKSNLTPGRKPTYFKTFGHAVRNMLIKRESIRSIAETLNISVNTVMDIKKKLKSLKMI